MKHKSNPYIHRFYICPCCEGEGKYRNDHGRYDSCFFCNKKGVVNTVQISKWDLYSLLSETVCDYPKTLNSSSLQLNLIKDSSVTKDKNFDEWISFNTN